MLLSACILTVVYRQSPRRAGSAPALRVLQAQHLAVVVVGEELGVAAPVDDRLQELVGLLLVEMVLELPQEPCLGGAVAGPLVEDAADMRGERGVGHGMLAEDALAALGIGI